MNTTDIKKLFDQYVLGNYAREDLCIVKGKGSYVWDIEGKKYLDFFPGWAVSGFGHCHPAVVNALRSQAGKLIHLANTFYNVPQVQCAKLIVENSFPSKVFFCNSGAEANEAAIKFARKYGSERGGRFEIITMKDSFHGRTLAAVTATGQAKYHKGFEPLPGGFLYATFNDFESVKKLVTDKTVAIMFEPVQGEGGVNIATADFVKKVKDLCAAKDILLILDEVQTGIGRTGKMFGYQHYGIEPDLMTLAKTLGGGAPIGALVVNNRLQNVLVPGTHASTFGGNPLVTRAGVAAFQIMKKERIIEKVSAMEGYLREKFLALKQKYPVIRAVRGIGVMWGLDLAVENAKPFVQKAVEKGLLINCTHGYVLRIIPALTVTRGEVNEAFRILDAVFAEMTGEKS